MAEEMRNYECSEEESEQYINKYSKPRKILAQFLAGTGNSLLVLSLGAAINVSTIVIASLAAGDDVIQATETHISWIGSLSYICQPIGSLFSGTITEAIGRKRALMVINLPTIVAWVMMWLAQDLPTLFIATALFGFGTGLTEAPTIAYIGEICEPSLRGVMAAYVSLFTSSGLFGVYLLGTILPWRKASAVCLAIPLFTILMVSMIPETPIWLLSKGRDEEAIRSLAWLRGWVKPAEVREEFEELIRYNENSAKCSKCEELTLDRDLDRDGADGARECPHRETSLIGMFRSKLRDLSERETLRPLVLSSLFFMFANMTGLSALKPNLINIFRAFNLSLDAHWATVGVGVLSIMGVLLCMCLVRWTGKRPLVLVCLTGSCISTFFLARYAYESIPHETSTYRPVSVSGEPSSAPLAWFVVLVLCNSGGVMPIAWLITTEVFPYKARGNALGIVAALCYIMNFVATKTYINLEKSLHIYGTLYFYSAFTLVGLIYLYLSLPETEGRTLEEIETDFASSRNIFADDFFINKLRSLLNGLLVATCDDGRPAPRPPNKDAPNKLNLTYTNEAYVESAIDLKDNPLRRRQSDSNENVILK